MADIPSVSECANSIPDAQWGNIRSQGIQRNTPLSPPPPLPCPSWSSILSMISPYFVYSTQSNERVPLRPVTKYNPVKITLYESHQRSIESHCDLHVIGRERVQWSPKPKSRTILLSLFLGKSTCFNHSKIQGQLCSPSLPRCAVIRTCFIRLKKSPLTTKSSISIHGCSLLRKLGQGC